jgi:uncharacterized protein (DUF305 family)
MKQGTIAFMALCASLNFTACNDNATTADNNGDTVSTHSEVSADTMHRMDTTSMNMNHAMMAPMNSMMDKMKSMSMTGDFDVDFANMMIQHHQGAIDMSQAEVSSGKDERIKSIAQRIITMQKEEIAKLQDFVKTYKPSGMKHGEGELQKSMSDMQAAMQSMQMSGDTDKDFATMMILHHEHGIAMGKKELANGMSDKLKAMVKKENASQEKDIKELQSLLASK